jgi:hypothetical protein
MREVEILNALGLPKSPIERKLKITVQTTKGNTRRFNVTIWNYYIGFGYIELYVSVRQIKGVHFDRLLRRIENNKPFGEWLALAQIPAEDEDDWIAQWKVIDLDVVPFARR